MPFGAHMSIAGGVAQSFARGEEVGCDVMQIFSKNDRQWQAKPLTVADADSFKAEQARTGIGPIIVHASYLINLAAPADELWEKSISALADELERCAMLGIPYLVLHPGSHTGSGEDVGLARVAAAFNRLFDAGAGDGVMVLMETTAGQGTTLGWDFAHLARLLELTTQRERLGICVDTCHIFAAGYDIRTPETFETTFTELDSVVGLHHIRAFHLNDSQKDFGSRVDRHDHIGKGCIGLEAFRLLVNDARFAEHPLILETPKGKDMAEDKENLATLRSLLS